MKSSTKNPRKKRAQSLTVQLNVLIPPELKDLMIQESQERDVGLNQLVAEVFAPRYGRPDLATIPRGRPGPRPQTRSTLAPAN